MVGRGGVTALAGYGLIALSLIGGLVVVVAESVALKLQVLGSEMPVPESTTVGLFVLVGLTVAIGVLGVVLASIGRQERDREEEFLLDPLRYPPFRHPWARRLALIVPIVLVLVLPPLFAVPVAHSVQVTLSVGVCSTTSLGPVQTLVLPAGAILAYDWRSVNGVPVSQVLAPDAPRWTTLGWVYVNSSDGHMAASSNGTAFPFAACDDPGTSFAAGSVVVVQGTYYTGLL